MLEEVKETVQKMKDSFTLKGRKYLTIFLPSEVKGVILPDSYQEETTQTNWKGVVIQTGRIPAKDVVENPLEDLEGKTIIVRGPQPAIVLKGIKYKVVHESAVLGYYNF